MQPEGGFAVYIHWPFCQAKCPYCDFNSHVRSAVDQDAWREALLGDLRHQASGLEGRKVDSVFFGGGTPSLMPPSTVAALIGEIRSLWPDGPVPEITLEANPTSVEAGRFAQYAEAGVNRISMGIQALNDADLRLLGRLHSAQEARDAFSVARGLFDRVSFDLIYARQGQSLAAWLNELNEAFELAVDHLSLYQLTIEPDTAFGRLHAAGRLRGLPDDDLGADMFEATQEACRSAGFEAYEVSNHARPGSECRHNLVYWRCGEYLGVGPGAHGRLDCGGHRTALVQENHPERWLELASDPAGLTGRSRLQAADNANEYLMMGLRLREGLSLARLERLGGRALDCKVLSDLIDDGLVEISGDRLRTTPRGCLVLNYIVRTLALDQIIH